MTQRIKASDEWKQLPWKKFRKIVFRLQLRIYKAQKVDDIKRVKRLQRLLLNSRAAKFLAVRQVTQLNTGKKTPGVDGKTALSPRQRWDVVQELEGWKKWKHRKLRRVWIPKKDGSKRGLGIPTILDRAYQCLIKYALEPACEAYFSAYSYGFRPGRSTHDVQKLIFDNLRSNSNGKNKKVLEMDIEKCFDKINHEALMSRVILPKVALNGIWRALKAGVKAECPSRECGTPQGGVISPLLANIAIHGLEDIDPKVRGIRYADDVIFIVKPNQDAKKLRTKIDKFLAKRGLQVKEAKTQLVKTTEGFDFLGWHFRVKPNGKFISFPSVDSYRSVKKKIKAALKENTTIDERIKKIGSLVRGWRNYHKYADMSKHSLWHTNNRAWKVINKCKSFNRHQTDEAIHKAFPSVSWSVNKHVMVKGNKSPYDGDIVYWSKRENEKYDGLTSQKLRKQKFHCNHCHLTFMPGDVVELHHIDGNHQNWKPKNLEALHRECHQDKQRSTQPKLRV